MATIPAKYIHHSKELRLRKKVAEQEKTISLLTSTLELQQKTNDLLVNVMGALLNQASLGKPIVSIEVDWRSLVNLYQTSTQEDTD